MSTWRRFLRFLLTACTLFVLVLLFSLANVDLDTRAGEEAFVVAVLALIPAVLTIIGVVTVISVDWDPF